MNKRRFWQFSPTPMSFLVLTTIVMAMAFAGWTAMLNNFAVEAAAFTGANMGMLQSLREIPGFLAFTAVFILLVLKEQTFAVISLCLLSIGVAVTGLFPTIYGLYATTVLMSIGFHYFETINQSLSLQWFKKDEAAEKLGQLLSVKSMAALVTFAVIWLGFSVFHSDYVWMYLLIGGAGLLVTMFLAFTHPQFIESAPQNKKLILRKEYSLYYMLVFFSGARRQIFMVFAGFLMVEKFGYDVAEITALYMLNHVINIFLAPKIGSWIGRIGEQKALTVEYIGLIGVFVGYAVVESANLAAVLYVIDHIFFAMAIALKTYFQKIAKPEDIAATAGVSFTINHIAAVFIPASFGVVWLYDQSLVFYFGAALAACSLILSQFITPHLRKVNNAQASQV
ncbi:MFS transporter [Pseudoalteromonas luteoviolacea]|uniref:Membrane protein n=1 Tax=Pseudoalteromonas luteoviolacea NCIMB 1942 TaxID=1365253 RepID=A0A162AB56_9GAMM|nr:MFS transporter [Pseudoalteromonas luteoviolacea]KZN46963.1 membrane protein [Pseudoalteromonas luteoviolacea NCIMB 1942]KZX00182.1 membrane protein [Pseudoalteromonas luteoviolacea]